MNRIFNWFRRRRLEQDLSRELAYQTDRRIADLMLTGVSEPEARRQAFLELGPLPRIQEEVRERMAHTLASRLRV